MTTLAQRLKEEMVRCKLTQDSLAIKAGMAQSSIYKLVSGKALESRKISKIAAALGVNTDWLATGKGEKYKETFLSLPSRPDTLKKLEMVIIPLIAFDRADEWPSALKDHHPDDGEIMTTPLQGQDLFAVTVPDDTMQSEFYEDEKIIIDPHREAKHKSFVLVAMGDFIVFRQLWNNAGEWLLKPLNERYDNRPLGDNRIIGVVRRKVREIDYD